MRKVISIFLLSTFFFNLSSFFSLAASFSPTYTGIFSDSNASVSPEVTLAVYQDSGEEFYSQIVFSFPAGFDIKGGSAFGEGAVIGTGNFQAKVGPSNVNFPVTVRSYSQSGSKAHWIYTINSLTVDAYLNGSIATGHTLSITNPSGLPISPPVSFVVKYGAGLFTNPSTGGPFTFSAHFISTSGLSADSSWSGSITAPLPGYPTPVYATPSPTYTTPYATPTVENNNQAQTPSKKNPPKVILNPISSPVRQNQVAISGKVTFENTIDKVEVSVDGGKNWFITRLANLSSTSLDFQFQTPPLEDDNYSVIARATDRAKNTGLSAKVEIVVDTTPPIVGGNELLLGGTSIFPEETGAITAVAGVRQKLIVSAKGGPQQINISSGKEDFPLTRIENSNLWQGSLNFNKEGTYPLTIKAVDGANNPTTRAINAVTVLPSGLVVDKNNGQAVKSNVELFTKDRDGQWLAWDGESYSQTNPIKTKADGSYSYFVPQGTYYLKVKADGYRDFISQEFSLSKPGQINFKISLTRRPTINLFGLPIQVPFWLDWGARIERIKLENTSSQAKVKKTLPLLPEAKLTSLDGNEKSLLDYKGTANIFTFWSSWNQASAEQLAEIAKVKGVRVVAIASQDSQGVVTSYLSRSGLNVEVLVDKNGEVGAQMAITSLPEHFFVNKEGKVLDFKVGIISSQMLMEIGQSLD